MTDTSASPEMPDAAQTAHFLRRFADLMSNGHNATYLLHAAVMIETLTASLAAISDEEQLWRYKYETMTAHNDMLEAECDSLKHDIDGHVNITNSILAERDLLKTALHEREIEMLGLGGALKHERDQLTAKSEAHEAALAVLRASFDVERMSLAATAQARTTELDRLRRVSEREREQLAANLGERDVELSGLRDELTASRANSEAEIDTLKAKLAALEAKRAELRSAFDRIGDLRIQTGGAAQATASSEPPRRLETETVLPLAPSSDRAFAPGEASTLVAKATLQQARAQFKYLAKDCTRRGDIATQVMCELGAYTLELALGAGDRMPSHLPVGEVALGILSPDSVPDAVAEQRLAAGG